MKNLIVYTLIATLSFPLIAKAEDMKLPVISRPAVLEEGTQTILSQAVIDELLPWAKDSKMFLNDLVENIQGLSTSDKIERLVDGIKQVVGESAPKNSELLMRYALNRGLVLHDLIGKEASDEAVGTADAKLRVLRASIDLAIKYYDTDMAILQKKTTAPYVIFGLDYFSFLSELNKSVFDASAQYAIQRTALEWLQWDLYRDLNNTAYAPQIVKINNSLKTFPSKKLTDAQSIASIRQMKKVAEQLNVKATLQKLEEDRLLSLAKTEEERKRMIAKLEEEKARKARESEIEKMREIRSAVDLEKVYSYSVLLNDSSWQKRRDAVNAISSIVGGDVTQRLLQRAMIENDSDVRASLSSSLRMRLGQTRYLLKIENMEDQNRKLVNIMRAAGRPSRWLIRVDVASYAGSILTIDSYRLLSEWLQIENDGDAKAAIVNAMGTLEKALNK